MDEGIQEWTQVSANLKYRITSLKHKFKTDVSQAIKTFKYSSLRTLLKIKCTSLFIYPTDAQLYCSKRMSKLSLKFTLKCSYMFRFNNHHQGATIHALLKL